jgi:lysophospholipase L1-like esterase
VVLVDLPTPADLDGRLYPREFAEYRAGLAQWASDHRTPLLRATREAVGLTDSDFADLIHLNADGAARFSTWLRRELEAGVGELRTGGGGTGP